MMLCGNNIHRECHVEMFRSGDYSETREQKMTPTYTKTTSACGHRLSSYVNLTQIYPTLVTALDSKKK